MNNRDSNLIRRRGQNDIYHTPLQVVREMIAMCDITADMTVLDPCYGAGAFYDNLPQCQKEWCEIEMGRDFFNETKRYDLIIGNPPYSKWNDWVTHTMRLTDKFCYIMGASNLTPARIRKIYEAGYGITKMHLLAIPWYFGSSFLVVFEKGKESILDVQREKIVCDVCNGRCKRGTAGYGPNECTKTTA